MRCEQCNKFAAFELMDEAEQQSLEVDEQGHVTAEYRAVLTHDECGSELKEYTFTLECDADREFIEKHTGNDHELSIEEDTAEAVEDLKSIQPKTSRGRVRVVTVYGVDVSATVLCSCDAGTSSTDVAGYYVHMQSERVESSSFEECQ